MYICMLFQVYISVTDVNDNFPMSDEPVLEAEVEENCASGTEVTQVKVVDRDGDGPMKFKIVAGNSDKLFRIGRSSGKSPINWNFSGCCGQNVDSISVNHGCTQEFRGLTSVPCVICTPNRLLN